MSGNWRGVRLGEVLVQNTEYIDAPEPRVYPKLSVKLYGKGVVLDNPADGSLLKMKRHQLARAGQVILSEIWGKKGAIGFVPPEGTGALCTSHFFLFDVLTDRLEPRWLQAIFSANYLQEQLEAEARGSTGYAAVRPKTLLACEIPLPPLAEQRRIVGRIEELAGKLAQISSLQRETTRMLESLGRAIAYSDGPTATVPMRELVRLREPDVVVLPSATYEFAGVYSFGRGVFKGEIRAGIDFSYSRLTRLRKGDFVYPKLMAWEGAFGVVPAECDGCVVSPEFPVFEIDSDRILAEVVDTHFKAPSVWPVISGASTGTNVRRRRLKPDTFLQYRMPVPPAEAQERLRLILPKIEMLRRFQEGASGDLAALLPSLLDKAFTGEL